VGGHCIPVYPHFYLQGDKSAKIVSYAREINDAMPRFVVSKIEKYFKSVNSLNIIIFGISYREKVKETYNSGALKLYKLLEEKNAKVLVYDENFSTDEIIKLGLIPFQKRFNTPDLVILHTYDENFTKFLSECIEKCEVVFDGTNRIGKKDLPKHMKILRLGD
jgi:UDP-N-acetyl-D-mannosaminuronate dehydrogenase